MQINKNEARCLRLIENFLHTLQNSTINDIIEATGSIKHTYEKLTTFPVTAEELAIFNITAEPKDVLSNYVKANLLLNNIINSCIEYTRFNHELKQLYSTDYPTDCLLRQEIIEDFFQFALLEIAQELENPVEFFKVYKESCVDNYSLRSWGGFKHRGMLKVLNIRELTIVHTLTEYTLHMFLCESLNMCFIVEND